MQENKPLLIVGLGNPGVEYQHTRHNVGFMAVDYLAGPDATWRAAHHALIATGTHNGHKVIYAKPQTYMNNSGLAVSAIMAYYKIPLENLTVIHDDMDLKTGDVREKTGGGSAGHNGIKSIDSAVGNGFHRIRIGINHPRTLGLPISPSDWVLGRFTPAEESVIQDSIARIN